MKKTILGFIALIITTGQILAQDNCSKFYPLTEGSSFEYTSYNKKGKEDGLIYYTISEVRSEGAATAATFDMKYTDKKGKEVFATDYSFTCENGVVKIDYESLFPSQMMQQYSEMGIEMDISGTDIALPNNLAVGQELSDANVSMAMNMSGIKMNVSIDQTNRKVEKKETITTPAGSFECYLLTETSTAKTMGATIETKSKLWLAEGIGMIKQESYKSNGSLMSSTELTKFTK